MIFEIISGGEKTDWVGKEWAGLFFPRGKNGPAHSFPGEKTDWGEIPACYTGTKHPMPFFDTPDKTSHKDLPPRTKIPCCFCHTGHNIPCSFCRPGHNIPCHFCHPGQNIPHSDCSFRVSLIWDLHLLLHVLAVNAVVRLSK